MSYAPAAREEENVSPQQAFLRLPLEERTRLLSEQTQDMRQVYETETAEREEWQTGDFLDYG